MSVNYFGGQDYYPFGMLQPGRTFSSQNYRFGFNGKENDNEIEGTFNWQDYGTRMYSPRVGRFISVDHISSDYPELSTYQFSSNNPIHNIDLDGLEGYQYLQTAQNSDGTTLTKRVVEVNIYVATSSLSKSIHYPTGEGKSIGANLNKEYNGKGFKDSDGLGVEFKFNVTEFDADKTTPAEFAQNLKRDKSNIMFPKDGMTTIQKGFVMNRGKIGYKEGRTLQNLSTISKNTEDPSHTQAHETGHIFLNYDPTVNPITPEDHSKAGGIFKYRVVDSEGNTKVPTEGVNQTNVDLILKTLPEAPEVTTSPK